MFCPNVEQNVVKKKAPAKKWPPTDTGGKSKSQSAPRASEMNPLENAGQAYTLTRPFGVPPTPISLPILYSRKILSASLAKAVFTDNSLIPTN